MAVPPPRFGSGRSAALGTVRSAYAPPLFQRVMIRTPTTRRFCLSGNFFVLHVFWLHSGCIFCIARNCLSSSPTCSNESWCTHIALKCFWFFKRYCVFVVFCLLLQHFNSKKILIWMIVFWLGEKKRMYETDLWHSINDLYFSYLIQK